jgi:hypothetical protein
VEAKFGSEIDGIMGFSDCGRMGLGSIEDRYRRWVCLRRVGFVGEGFVVADRGIESVIAEEWWVSSEIWLWKLGVGEEASLPVRGDLAGDKGWVGLGWVMEARV